MSEVENRPIGGVTTSASRRAVCDQHKYGSVRAAPGDGGGYSSVPSMECDL